MKLLTKDQHAQLLKNGQINAQRQMDGLDTIDHRPVVKLFTPDGACTWLLSELEPEDNDIAFGLCDLGFGTPEMGSVRLSEIESLRGRLGLPVERDLHFTGRKPLSAYADEARIAGHIKA
ncbi:MAG: DUF2958 domain-containing protein [Alphaproteobacteria bacterium]|nr:DUF2958 domain-containing protein [Alphaproteobacteria bacterium]